MELTFVNHCRIRQRDVIDNNQPHAAPGPLIRQLPLSVPLLTLRLALTIRYNVILPLPRLVITPDLINRLDEALEVKDAGELCAIQKRCSDVL